MWPQIRVRVKFSGEDKKKLQVETGEVTLNDRATGFSRFHAAFRQVASSGHEPKQPKEETQCIVLDEPVIETDRSTREVEILASYSWPTTSGQSSRILNGPPAVTTGNTDAR